MVVVVFGPIVCGSKMRVCEVNFQSLAAATALSDKHEAVGVHRAFPLYTLYFRHPLLGASRRCTMHEACEREMMRHFRTRKKAININKFSWEALNVHFADVHFVFRFGGVPFGGSNSSVSLVATSLAGVLSPTTKRVPGGPFKGI